MTSPVPPSEATTVRRTERAAYDRDSINAILDAEIVCHVGFVHENRPVVIPMFHVRIGGELILHGAHATRLFRVLKNAPEICVTVTILDGLVLARSAYNHSANYRSVVLFGKPSPVEDLSERAELLDRMTDHLVPDRRPHLRPMSDKEVRGTALLKVPIDEASAKVRSGPPIDEDEDYEFEVWAGVLPRRYGWGEPEPDPRNLPGLVVPEHVSRMVTE